MKHQPFQPVYRAVWFFYNNQNGKLRCVNLNTSFKDVLINIGLSNKWKQGRKRTLNEQSEPAIILMMFKRTQGHFVVNIFTFSSLFLVSWNFDITCSVVKILLSYKMNERESAVLYPDISESKGLSFQKPCSSSRSEPLDSYSSYLYDGILLNLSKTSEKSQWKKSRMLQMNPP